MEELLAMLRQRLDEHNNNRVEVQSKLDEACAKIQGDANTLEDTIDSEIAAKHKKYEEQVLSFIEKLNKGGGGGKRNGLDSLMKRAENELSKATIYEIHALKKKTKTKMISELYKLKVTHPPPAKVRCIDNTGDGGGESNDINDNKIASITARLQEHLESASESMEAARARLTEICDERRKEAEELRERINGALEKAFEEEDGRLQEAVRIVVEKLGSRNPEEVNCAEKKGRTTLLIHQSYSLSGGDSGDDYELEIERKPWVKSIEFEDRKPSEFCVSLTPQGDLSVSFAFFSDEEVSCLKEFSTSFFVEVDAFEKGGEGHNASKTFRKEFNLGSCGPIIVRSPFSASTIYVLRMRIVHQDTRTQ